MRIVVLASICLLGHSVLAGDFNDAMNSIVPKLVDAPSQPANTSAGGEWYVHGEYNSPMGHKTWVLGPYASEQAAKNDAERAVQGNGTYGGRNCFTYTIEHRGGASSSSSSSSSGGSGLAGFAGGLGTGGGSPQQVLAQGLLGACFGAMASSMESGGTDQNQQQAEQERQRREQEEIQSVAVANQRRTALRQAVTIQRTAREATNQKTDEEMKSALDDSWMLASLAKPKTGSSDPKVVNRRRITNDTVDLLRDTNRPAIQETGNSNIVDLGETNNTSAGLQPDLSQPANTVILARGNMSPSLLRRPDKNPAPVVSWSPPAIPKSSMDRKSYQECMWTTVKDDSRLFDPLLEAIAGKIGLASIQAKIDNCRDVFKTLTARNETTLSKTFDIMNRMARGESVDPEEAWALFQELGDGYKEDAKRLIFTAVIADIGNSPAGGGINGNQQVSSDFPITDYPIHVDTHRWPDFRKLSR